MPRSAPLLALGLGAMLVAGCGAQPATNTAAPSPGSPGSSGAPVVAAKPTTLTVSVAPWRLPFAIAREAVVPLGSDAVMVGGGMLPDDSSSARTYQLALRSGQVNARPPLSIEVHDVAGGFYGGEPAIYGGGNSSEQSTVQQFHHGAWRVIDHMPTTRSDLSVGVVGTTTYVLGGYDGTGVPTQILAQDAGSAGLELVGQLAEGVRYAATAVSGSSIYLFGGEVSGAELSVVQRFDTVTRKTTVVAQLPVAVGHASAAVLGGRILLVGGRIHPDQGTSAMWWFDPSTAKFTQAGTLPVPVTDAAVAVSADGLTAWLLGGEAPTVRDGVIELKLS